MGDSLLARSFWRVTYTNNVNERHGSRCIARFSSTDACRAAAVSSTHLQLLVAVAGLTLAVLLRRVLLRCPHSPLSRHSEWYLFFRVANFCCDLNLIAWPQTYTVAALTTWIWTAMIISLCRPSSTRTRTPTEPAVSCMSLSFVQSSSVLSACSVSLAMLRRSSCSWSTRLRRRQSFCCSAWLCSTLFFCSWHFSSMSYPVSILTPESFRSDFLVYAVCQACALLSKRCEANFRVCPAIERMCVCVCVCVSDFNRTL